MVAPGGPFQEVETSNFTRRVLPGAAPLTTAVTLPLKTAVASFMAMATVRGGVHLHARASFVGERMARAAEKARAKAGIRMEGQRSTAPGTRLARLTQEDACRRARPAGGRPGLC